MYVELSLRTADGGVEYKIALLAVSLGTERRYLQKTALAMSLLGVDRKLAAVVGCHSPLPWQPDQLRI